MRIGNLLTVSMILIVIAFSSCEQVPSDHQVVFDDSIKQAVLQYIREENVDVRSRVISISWKAGLYRTDIFITNSAIGWSDSLLPAPTYYSILDDSIVVFLYAGFETALRRNSAKISREVGAILQQRNIELAPDNLLLYHEPVWMYTICGDSTELMKPGDSSLNELLEIPCGYMLIYDTLESDSSYLVVKHE